MSGYHRFADSLTPEKYLKGVMEGSAHDPVTTFLMRCGHSSVSIVRNYFEDEESHHYAALMEWRNPFKSNN